jgi:hypothetical protein
MKRASVLILMLALLLSCTACPWQKKPPKAICDNLNVLNISVQAVGPVLQILADQGQLPPEVSAEYQRFKPCAAQFVTVLQAWCEQNNVPLSQAKSPVTAKSSNICTAAYLLDVGVSITQQYIEPNLDQMSPAAIATYNNFKVCAAALRQSLVVHGNCQ